MTELNKKEIQTLLKDFVEQYPSQAKAVVDLKNVSEATIINIKKGNWESISDEMWRTVGKQVGFSNKGGWQLVETNDFKSLRNLIEDAQEFSNVYAITAGTGTGKTFTCEWYEKNRENAFHLECEDSMNKRVFLSKLLEKMGYYDTGFNVNEMIDLLIQKLMRMENPVILLDEFDKLPDAVIYFFITFYNRLKGKCGIVLLATDQLSKMIMKGKRLNRKGYQEIYSRIGRRFLTLKGTSKAEVSAICTANGINDIAEINTIYNEYEGDLRRVERAVHKNKRMSQRKQAA